MESCTCPSSASSDKGMSYRIIADSVSIGGEQDSIGKRITWNGREKCRAGREACKGRGRHPTGDDREADE